MKSFGEFGQQMNLAILVRILNYAEFGFMLTSHGSSPIKIDKI